MAVLRSRGGILTLAEPQMKRFCLGDRADGLPAGMADLALAKPRGRGLFRHVNPVDRRSKLFGCLGMGAQRWIELGSFRLHATSELMKITL